MTDEEKNIRAYETALTTRNFEISLFWQRSLFFLGFIGAAFVGHAALRDADSSLSLILACFGLVCSVAWSLVNRGSKYWQEAWEHKVDSSEDTVTGALFKLEVPAQGKGWWLSARRYSVSKLTIALSDYSALVWIALLGWEALRLLLPAHATGDARLVGAACWVVFTGVYCIALLWFGRSSPRAAAK